jgi:curved DNA-binding protein CbpA
MKDFIDYYSVLEIPPDADLAAVRSSYRLLAKRHHPDSATRDKAEAANKFRLIRAAYEVLSDPQRRARHDQERRRRLHGQPAPKIPETSTPAPDERKDAWKKACRDDPELEGVYSQLFAISPSLASEFRDLLSGTSTLRQGPDIRSTLKAHFLARYLDLAPQLLRFPDWIR